MSSRILGTFAAAIACAKAASISPRAAANNVPGVLAFQVLQETKITQLTRKRAIDTDVPVLNVSSSSYLIELNVGTPGQTVKVAIDTGSSELWVNPNCDNAGTASQEKSCVANGHYNPRTSSSSQVSSEEGHVKYGKGEVVLQYVADNIALPGSAVDLQAVKFGYATDSVDLNMGILGLSFGLNFNLNYPGFIDELVLQNLTATRAFGVALGNKAEQTNSGLITFGGVDTRKFSGRLHTSPMLGPQNRERLYRYWVQLDSIALNGKVYSGSNFPVFFDTGATLSYLPSRIVAQLASDLSGFKDSESGLYIVPCRQSGSIAFAFGDMIINVSLDEFIWDVGLRGGQCVLGADAADDGSFLLGDSFLRSTYVVFDVESPALHFAPYVNCGTNLQAIPQGANAAASLQGECTTKKNAAPAVVGPVPGPRVGAAAGAVIAALALL